METKRICPSCRKPLPPDVPLGLCPECLIKSGFNTGTDPGNPGKESSFVPPPVEQLRTLFPQLEILELIGKGGMGAVYKARQLALDRLVALKVLPPGAADDAGFAERFNREARALARLNHPHIVAVHDFGQAGGQPYLVMEFVDGPNLRQVEQAGRLTPEQALEIVPQICEALQFAHNEGVVHRDIKPENILLDKKGRVKITDFGIAKIVGVPAGKASLTGAKDVLGTPHYMAPEQVEKPSTVDHRADIYSLGVVFYELLTGELPLGKFQPPSKKVQVDVRLDEVVLHALEKEPERRYQQASQVKTDVETIAGTPVAREVQPAPPHVPVLRWRDLWLWDNSNVVAMAMVPMVVSFALTGVLWPFWGKRALLFLLLWGLGLAFAAMYAVVGAKVRRLKAALPRPTGEVAEALMFRRPLQSPGLAVLHSDRLELRWISGTVITVHLDEITAVAEVRWFNGTRLWLKKGFVLDLANGQRVGVAVPEPFARRWRARLSRGTLPEIPPDSEPVESRLMPAAIHSMVKAPANWLVATGILNLIAIPLIVLVTAAMVPDKGGVVFTAPTLLAIILSSVIILAGLRMKRLEAYPLAIVGSILAMLVTPGNIVGLPVGIWCLVVLCRREVREAFGKPYSPAAAMPEELDYARQKVQAPAVAIIIVSVLSFLLLVGWSQIGGHGVPIIPLFLVAGILHALVILGAVQMWRCQTYGLAVAAGILAMMLAPACILGIPLGIWALAVLSRREVRAAFGRKLPPASLESRQPSGGGGGEWKVTAVIVAAILLILAIPIGAILLSIGVPAFMKARDRARAVAAQNSAEPMTAMAIRFGPVREVTLNDLDDRNGNEALSFASGQLLFLPADFRQRTAEARVAWLDSNRVDLLVDFARDRWALMTRSMKFRDLPNEAWNSPDIEFGGQWPDSEVLEKREHRGDTFYLLPTNAQTPLTFAFQTSAGSHGVLQIAGFTENPRNVKLRYKLAQLAGGGGGGSVASADQNAQRKFVRLVVDKTAMTFEGQPTSWEGVGALLAKVPDRNNTVLEFAVTSDQITVAQQNEWFQKASALARQHGFEYASFIGIHPFGSKGTSNSSAPSVPPFAPAAFGPVMTRSVSGEGDARRRFIDFETGRQFAASEFFGPKAEPSPEETQKWWKEYGIDAMGDTSPAVLGLVGLDMIAVPVPLHEWDMPPARLDYYLAAAKPGTPAIMSAKGDLPATFVIQTREGGSGLLQITGFSGTAPNTRSVMIRYKLAGPTGRDGEQGARDAAPAKARPFADQAIVEDLALQMLVAIRDKDDTALKALAVDRISGWREALPQFALEMRERFQQGRGRPFNLMPTESLVEGDSAVVKCDDPKATNQIYLVLHLVRTDDGWKNWSLRNSPPSTPLAEHLKRTPPASPAGGTKPGR